jgi:DNA polymerase
MSPQPSGGDARQQFLKLVDQARALLAYEREEGRREVEADPELVQQLGRWAAAAAGPAQPSLPLAAVPPAAPPDEPGEAAQRLAGIAARIAACTACPLHPTRTRTVPGQGALRPDVMFIGEGPGQDEDRQGLAFVGRAGQLLTKIIEAMGYPRDQVFIGNIVKCRPPENRAPEPAEMAACLPFLREQIACIRPRVIVALGGTNRKSVV